MKKMTFIVCAAMLASAVLFTGCKKDENAPEKKNEVVKSEFSIALPDQLKAPSRMPGTTVQVNGRSQFQGMRDYIILVPFVHQRAITGADTRLGDNIQLGGIAAASELGTASNAKVYSNVAIPLTTASFLFYAESAATGTNFQKGVLTASNLDNDNPSAFNFDLTPIVASVGAAHGDPKAVALLAYLNSIANATDGAATPKAWKDYQPADDAGMAALFETYTKGKGNVTNAVQVISSANVQRMVSDLYNSLVPLTHTLSTNIKAAIAAQATVTAPVAPATDYTVVLNSDLSGFPANLNLPDGAIHAKYDGTAKAFRFLTETEYTSNNFAALNLYTYPSSLWYRANSLIKTSNSSKQAMYNNENNWATILAAHDAARAVNSLTRAVAIEDQIQYAVARMDVQVKLDAGALEDNAADPKSITCASYPITGVLVGGQKNVGWDFTPNGTNVYTIYDQSMTDPDMAATTSYSAMNSTLVLETEGGTSSDKDVMIAIEFQNASGQDFNGVDGCLIPAGSKFYVLARLVAAEADEAALEHKVFKQDYTTTVRLNLKNLKNAYNTIPDLRTPKLELGFSVNLDWTPGHTYAFDF